jgi:hypothetical protein
MTMRSLRGVQFAGLVFALVVGLAVTALVWGSRPSHHAAGSGTPTQLAAARRTILTMSLPAGYAHAAPAFCGITADLCVTSPQNITETLASLRVGITAEGGALPALCQLGLKINPAPAPAVASNATSGATTTASPAPTAPTFVCIVDGKLGGAAVSVWLGDGVKVAGQPAPRTVALVIVGAPKP